MLIRPPFVTQGNNVNCAKRLLLSLIWLTAAHAAHAVNTSTQPVITPTHNTQVSHGPLRIAQFDGPVTQQEIASFVGFISDLQPPALSIGNDWAQGHSGENLKAMALVYELSGRVEILDRMVLFCDALLSQRNDLLPAPNGQHLIWTGRIDPVWPNDLSAASAQTGGEQGDPIGHLGNCARLILRTPALQDTVVPFGDPQHFGKTYFDRAKTYLTQADHTVDVHILPALLDLSRGDRMYFSSNSPYQSGKPVPWNQQMMFDYGFVNLAQAHELLGDDPARVKRYDHIVQANLDWFFQSGITRYQDNAGNTAYDWGYVLPNRSAEDGNHGSLDVAGLCRAYASGRYHLTEEQMAPIANTVADVLRLDENHFAGRLNGSTGEGHSSGTNYLRGGYLFSAQFRPAAFAQMLHDAHLKEGMTTAHLESFSRYLWVKYQLAGGAGHGVAAQ
jgi:hypothetical protein